MYIHNDITFNFVTLMNVVHTFWYRFFTGVDIIMLWWKENFISDGHQFHYVVFFECAGSLSFYYICIAFGDPVIKRGGLESH
jgi:hypothetical protein